MFHTRQEHVWLRSEGVRRSDENLMGETGPISANQLWPWYFQRATEQGISGIARSIVRPSDTNETWRQRKYGTRWTGQSTCSTWFATRLSIENDRRRKRSGWHALQPGGRGERDSARRFQCNVTCCSITRDGRRFLRKVCRSSVWALRINHYLVDFNLWSLLETYCLYILCVVNWVGHDSSLDISWHPFLMSSVIMWGHNVVFRLVY